MWWVEAGVISYLALCCLARANHRYRSVPLAGAVLVRPVVARFAGWLLLGADATVCLASLGPAQGTVGFCCVVAVVGLGFVLLLSVRPRVALAPAMLLPGTRRRHG